MLKIYFLGVPQVTKDEIRLPALTGAQITMRLFAFLVMQRDQPHARDQVATLFWPELAATRARAALSNVIWRLREALGDAGSVLLTDKTTVQFDPSAPYWLDVEEFDHQTRDLLTLATARQPSEQVIGATLAEFEDALALYRGDFLAGMDDAWIVSQRSQWRERAFSTFEHYSDACQLAGESARALSAAHQLTTLDPDRQIAHQRLIELYLTPDRTAEARRHFAHYAQHWQHELHLPLSAEMLHLAEEHGLRTPTIPEQPRSGKRKPVPIELSNIRVNGGEEHPEYLRRELAIRLQNDELYDLKADRQRQRENLVLAQALVDMLSDPATRIDLLARRAWLATRQGEYTEALTWLQEGLQCCETNKLPALRAQLHRLFGVASEETGNFTAALHHYRRALTLDEAQPAPALLPANLNNVASVEITLAHYLAAIQHLERAHALLKPNTPTAFQVKVIGNLGVAWLKLGQLTQAQRYLQQAMTLAQRTGEHDAEWWLATKLALLYQLSGDINRGLHLALHYYNVAQPSGDAWVLAALSEVLAELYLHAQDGEQSKSWAQRTIHYAHPKGQWRYEARGRLRLAQAHRLAGQSEAGLACLAQADARYQKKGQALEEEAELFYTYSQCAHDCGQTALADQAAQQAHLVLQCQLQPLCDATLRTSFLAIRPFAQQILAQNW